MIFVFADTISSYQQRVITKTRHWIECTRVGVLLGNFFSGGGKGVCGSLLQTLTLFQAKMCGFLLPFSDLASQIHPYFQTRSLESIPIFKIQTKMLKIYTHFRPKRLQKPYPLSPTTNIGKYPIPRESGAVLTNVCFPKYTCYKSFPRLSY